MNGVLVPAPLAPATKRPALLPGEAVLATVGGIGLYEGNTRLAEFDSGVVYATTHRIVWVDDVKNSAVAITLSSVRSVSGAAGFNPLSSSFLRSSPKVVLHLARGFQQSAPSPSTASAVDAESTWDCSVCDAVNLPGTAACETCGVRRRQQASPPPQRSTPSTRGRWSCPTCTFENHAALPACEMCETPRPDTATSGAPPPPPPLAASANDSDLVVVKLSCRAGSHTDLLKAIQSSVSGRKWESVVQAVGPSLESGRASNNVLSSGLGGIAGIVRNAESNTKATDDSLAESFKDLDALMAKAAEMVKLAESINSKLATSGISATSNDAPELVAFRSYLVELGIPSPVTKETAGDLYTQELAKELAEFLDKALRRHGGMIALTDLDDAMATRILEHARAAQSRGVSAYDVAKTDNIPVLLANEQLLLAERFGIVCRDSSWEGVRFHENLIASVYASRTPYA
ncbi:Vacuolar protein-sorting-associated protein 36 [Cladochytrium tenue]|nr:Vacuolar protein-sorting-associated protein 36 [Cladochytrium tenue]